MSQIFRESISFRLPCVKFKDTKIITLPKCPNWKRTLVLVASYCSRTHSWKLNWCRLRPGMYLFDVPKNFATFQELISKQYLHSGVLFHVWSCCTPAQTSHPVEGALVKQSLWYQSNVRTNKRVGEGAHRILALIPFDPSSFKHFTEAC